MDNNLFDLVYFCKEFSKNWQNIHYKYVLEKFTICEDLNSEKFSIFELLQKPLQVLNDLLIFERSNKKRKLKPIQFAKEKQEKLNERLKNHLEMLKAANLDKDKERVAKLKIEIEEIKNLIAAHKDNMKLIKLNEK
jgi:phosphoenolpyruvate synthase/pyruvate phosphate dikinase